MQWVRVLVGGVLAAAPIVLAAPAAASVGTGWRVEHLGGRNNGVLLVVATDDQRLRIGCRSRRLSTAR